MDRDFCYQPVCPTKIIFLKLVICLKNYFFWLLNKAFFVPFFSQAAWDAVRDLEALGYHGSSVEAAAEATAEATAEAAEAATADPALGSPLALPQSSEPDREEGEEMEVEEEGEKGGGARRGLFPVFQKGAKWVLMPYYSFLLYAKLPRFSYNIFFFLRVFLKERRAFPVPPL